MINKKVEDKVNKLLELIEEEGREIAQGRMPGELSNTETQEYNELKDLFRILNSVKEILRNGKKSV